MRSTTHPDAAELPHRYESVSAHMARWTTLRCKGGACVYAASAPRRFDHRRSSGRLARAASLSPSMGPASGGPPPGSTVPTISVSSSSMNCWAPGASTAAHDALGEGARGAFGIEARLRTTLGAADAFDTSRLRSNVGAAMSSAPLTIAMAAQPFERGGRALTFATVGNRLGGCCDVPDMDIGLASPGPSRSEAPRPFISRTWHATTSAQTRPT